MDRPEMGEKRAAILAQFHAAEYSVIMARISAWTQLQYAAWPILIGAFALLAQMGNISPKYRWWAGLITTLAVYVAYQSTMVGMLTYVLLIEEYVRPRAAVIVGTDEFWLHERVWRKKLPANPAWSPWWPPVISFLVIALVPAGLVYYFGLHAMDWRDLAALLVALLLGVFVMHLTRSGMRLSNEITKICNQSPIAVRTQDSHRVRAPRGRRHGKAEE
jgi:hypothetical protein